MLQLKQMSSENQERRRRRKTFPQREVECVLGEMYTPLIVHNNGTDYTV